MMNTLFSRINITKPTEKELILRVNPILAHLVASAFMGFALLMFLFSITTTSATALTCEKSLLKDKIISCQLLTNSFLGIRSEQKLSFSDSPKAQIVTKVDKEANKANYKALLLTSTDEIVLVSQPISYHYQEWEQNIIKINDFIENTHEKSLLIKEKNDDLVFAGLNIAFFLVFVSVIIWAARTNITCFISLDSKKILIERQRFFTKKMIITL